MTTFTVSTYKSTQTVLGIGDWLVVSYFGTIAVGLNGVGAVDGTGSNAIQVDGVVSNASTSGSGMRLTGGGGNTVVVGTNGQIEGGSGGLVIQGGGNTISCAGTIRASSSSGISLNGPNNTITIAATGTVSGESQGVLAGGGTTVTNLGTINSDATGVSLQAGVNSITNAGLVDTSVYAMIVGSAGSGTNTIVNTGVVRCGGGIVTGDGNTALFNSGMIDSLNFSGYASTGSSAIINNGLIFSRASLALTLGESVDTVINNSLMQGNGVAVHLGGGNDLFDGRLGVQVGLVNGVAGNDTIYGGAQSDMLAGGTDNDTLYGMAGVDALAGGDGIDTLYGGDGADNLMGEAGTDLIYGGAGGDVIRGGLGGDLIAFNAGDNGDLIQNFNEGGVRDGFDLRGYFNATGYTGTTPRAAGIMQVLQNGADTDVYLHGAFAFRVQGVVAAAIDDTYFLFQ